MREVAGARRDSIELNALLQRVVVTDAAGEAIEELRTRQPQLSARDVRDAPYLLIGTVEEIVQALRERRSRSRRRWRPVVARLAGS